VQVPPRPLGVDTDFPLSPLLWEEEASSGRTLSGEEEASSNSRPG